MKLSIISAVSRDELTIKNFLSSIYENSRNISFDIEIVLAAPAIIKTIEWSKYFINEKINLKIIVSDKSNPMQKRNAAINESTGDIIAIVDDDIKFTKEWFNTVYTEFKDSLTDKFILTGPSNLLYDNSLSQKLSSLIINNFFNSLRKTEINQQKSKIYFMDAAFCNCAFQKNIMDATGLLEEKVNFYLDDTLFFYKADAAGIPIFNHPKMIVAHKRKKFPINFFADSFKKKYFLGFNYLNYNYLYKKDIVTNICALTLIPLIFLLFYDYYILIGGALILAVFAGISAYLRNKKFFLTMAACFLIPFSAIFSVLFFYIGLIGGLFNLFIYKKFEFQKKLRNN